MSEKFLKAMGLLNDLDLEMSNRIKRIRQLYEPSRKDLDTLFSLYKLNILKYTNLNEISNILENYGYFIPEISNVDISDKNIISNRSTETEQTIIKDDLPITSSVQNIPSDFQTEDSSEKVKEFVIQLKERFYASTGF